MSPSASREKRKRAIAADAIGYVVITTGVWLAWQVVQAPIALRAPPGMAMRMASGSPAVLSRAAEAELAEGRTDNAKALAEASLARAPFNAKALRVRGLVEARSGDASKADDMLTLAGNWSLRDDPAHAWLVENRLRRGDYASAFAHADTLARRRADLYPRLFELFTLAAAEPRGLNALITLIAKSPPWRKAYLEYLFARNDSNQLLASLAILLESTPAPLTPEELQMLHSRWAGQAKFQALRVLREQMKRPPMTEGLQDGGFENAEASLYPFGWLIGAGPGVSASVVEDDLKPGNLALRFEYDGVGVTPIADQLLLLSPGVHALTGEMRMETAGQPSRLRWAVTCIETGVRIAEYVPSPLADAVGWRRFEARMIVPAENCSAQSVALLPRPEDGRTTISGWVDNLRMAPAGPR